MLDLRQLLGREEDSFSIKTLVTHQGMAVEANTLIDTGANAFACIDSDLANKLSNCFRIPMERIAGNYGVTGFSGEGTTPLTHAIFLDLVVDGRKLPRTPFLILKLGRHDMILGQLWLKKHHILPDCSTQQLRWPEDLSLFDEVSTKMFLLIPPRALNKQPISREYQQEIARRDRKIEQEERSVRARYQPLPTQQMDYQTALAKMESAIKASYKDPDLQWPPEPKPKEQRKTGRKPIDLGIDIAVIGAAGFHRTASRKGNTVFVTSIAEIDAILADRNAENPLESEEDEIAQIKQTLPPQYHDMVDVFQKQKSDELPPLREGHNAKIELTESNNINYGPLYKMSAEELEAVRQYIVDNLGKGFIEPSTAPFASPILMAEKPGGGLRFCVDYRKLNAITRKDRYPIPLINEVLERISHAKIFTKLDIRQGFHRLRMDPESEELTTFRSRFGSFKYKVMPFGLTNGPAIFQRYVNSILMDCLDKFVTAFVDDLLIYSDNILEHETHVRTVLERLRAAGLQAAIHKCEFHVTRTKYLGFIISTEGIEVDPAKTSSISNWSVPNTVRGVQSFLGFCNFYRRFIKDYSRIASPLNRLTRKDASFVWSNDCQEAFETLKRALTSTPVLRHYDPQLPTRVETDASQGVVAGVLQQKHGDLWHPAAYFSKTMSTAELNYDIHDKEMLAIIRSLTEWRAELEGLQREDRFDIYTDHRALEYFMTKQKLNRRQANWSEFLSRFHFLIRYRPGKENTLADALSRPEKMPDNAEGRTAVLLRPEWLEEGVLPQNFIESAPGVRKDIEIAPLDRELHIVDRILTRNRDSPLLEPYREKAREERQDWTLDEEGRLLFQNRLVVPDEDDLLARLLDEIHRQPSTAHPGRTKMKALVKARYYWPTWSRDVARYLDNCMVCKRTKEPRDLPPGLLNPLPIPERPWQHINVDFRSFPKSKNGYDAAFVAVCRLSKRGHAVPCKKTITACEMARLFIVHFYPWVGLPDSVVSDRGGQFVSEFWDEFCKILGVKVVLTSGQHPEANGQVEVMNQWIAQRLRPFISYYQDDWDDLLPVLNFASACLPSESTGISPFLVERGFEPRMSMDWRTPAEPSAKSASRRAALDMAKRIQDAWGLAKKHIARSQERMKRNADRKRRDESFKVDDWVMLTTDDWDLGRPSKKLAEQMTGPYRVVEKVGNSYKLDLPPELRIHPVFSPDKLRRASQSDPLPGQIIDPQGPLEINGQEEWEVEEIVASRLCRKKLQYKARYIGYDFDNKWYPASDFMNAPERVAEYHEKYPDRPGPPKRLAEWLQAAKADKYLPVTDDDDLPAARK